MKENKGVTMISLVVIIALLTLIAGISIGQGSKVIKSSQLENLKTNMLLIKVKAKEYVENANFKLGTNFEKATDKETRITTAKGELKGEEITDSNIFGENMNITEETITRDNANCIYYYKLNKTDLTDMGLSNIKSDEKNGWYIIKYDIKYDIENDIENEEVEVYNTAGFEYEGKMYYSLTELQDINL